MRTVLFLAEVSHVLVSFVEEDTQPTAIIPVKRVKDCEVRDLHQGVMCQIEWSDKKDTQHGFWL